jgi:hypothetical protein
MSVCMCLCVRVSSSERMELKEESYACGNGEQGWNSSLLHAFASNPKIMSETRSWRWMEKARLNNFIKTYTENAAAAASQLPWIRECMRKRKEREREEKSLWKLTEWGKRVKHQWQLNEFSSRSLACRLENFHNKVFHLLRFIKPRKVAWNMEYGDGVVSEDCFGKFFLTVFNAIYWWTFVKSKLKFWDITVKIKHTFLLTPPELRD